jgi:CO/xanthine dehydrogenase Mo-binding subunit
VQPLLAACAWKLGRAVRLVYERPESMQSSTKRHPAEMRASAACDGQGRLVAFDFAGDFNTGAYSSWGPTVANRVPIHASGPYRVPNVRALTRAVLTHNSVAGAFRGFGVPQSTLVCELLIDELAAATGSDPLEFRHANALVAGDSTPTGQVLAASVGLQECLDALRPAWRDAVDAAGRANDAAIAGGSPLRRGAGIACMWYGIGNTVIANPSTMRGALRWSAERGAHLMLYNGAQEIGQGTATIMPQMFADAVGLPLTCVEQVMGDTDRTADAGKSSASRQTFVSGNAARTAGAELRRRLLEHVGLADREGESVSLVLERDRLLARSGGAERAIDLRALAQHPHEDAAAAAGTAVGGHPGDLFLGSGHFNPPTIPLDADGQGVPYATYGFAAQIAEVEVDVELGTVRLLHIHAAHDVGRAIHPTLVEGQIHGGIAQGIGMALMEEYVNGRTDNLHDYLIPTVGDVPPITVHLVEDPEPLGPWGAKGVGEPALVATAPAILNAIHAATGVRMREVPATPARLRAALLAAPSPARGRGPGCGWRPTQTRTPTPSRKRERERSACARTASRSSRRSKRSRSSSSTRARPRRWPPTRCAARRARCSARSAPASSARATATATSTASWRGSTRSIWWPAPASISSPGRRRRKAAGTARSCRRATATRRSSSRASARGRRIPTTSRRPSSSPRSTRASTSSPSSPKGSSATAASR